MVDYAVRIVRATRDMPGLAIGSGSRGALALVRGARAVALLDGRDYVTPDDIKRIALPALRHRIALAPDALLEGRTTNDLLARSRSRRVAAPADVSATARCAIPGRPAGTVAARGGRRCAVLRRAGASACRVTRRRQHRRGCAIVALGVAAVTATIRYRVRAWRASRRRR